jgi:YfdX protein
MIMHDLPWRRTCCVGDRIRRFAQDGAERAGSDESMLRRTIPMHTNTMKPLAPVVAALAVLMTTTAVVPPAAAEQPQLQATETAQLAVTPDTMVSAAAASAWRHIAQARGELVRGDSAVADRELGEALGLLDGAEASLPTAAARDEIWVARTHLGYEDIDEVMADFAPIYSSLQALGSTVPVQEAKQHVDRAKDHLSRNEATDAMAELDAASSALVYKEVDIPLNMTRRLVNEARQDIRANDSAAAENALKAAEDNVVYLSVVVYEPLGEAQQSLWQAGQDYAAGAYRRAASGVDRAIAYFDLAVHDGDNETRSAARALSEQARSLEARIDAKAETVPAELDTLWRRAKALSERSAEFFATGWQRVGIKSDAKADLIEAKLHLAYADIDRFTALEPEQAAEELGLAQSYLDQAAEHSPADRAGQITAVRDSVKDLAVEPAPDQHAGQYTSLMGQLGHLIETL